MERAVEHVQHALQQHIAEAAGRAAPASQDAVRSALNEMALVVTVQLRTLLPALLEQKSGGGAPSPFGGHDWSSCGSLEEVSSVPAGTSSGRAALARTGLAAYAAGQLAASVHLEQPRASNTDLKDLAQVAMQMLEQESERAQEEADAKGADEGADEGKDKKSDNAAGTFTYPSILT